MTCIGLLSAPGLFQNHVLSVFSGLFCNLQSHRGLSAAGFDGRRTSAKAVSILPSVFGVAQLLVGSCKMCTLECVGGLKLSLPKGHTYLWTRRITSVMPPDSRAQLYPSGCETAELSPLSSSQQNQMTLRSLTSGNRLTDDYL